MTVNTTLTQEHHWRALLETVQQGAEEARAELDQPDTEALSAAEARGRLAAYEATARIMRKQRFDLQPDAEAALVQALAQAAHLEAVLSEMGRLAVEQAQHGMNKRSEARMAELLMPYVMLAMPSDSTSVQ